MVHFKIATLFISLFIATGCKGQNRQVDFYNENLALHETDSMDYKYCFTEIKDSLNNLKVIDASNRQTVYRHIEMEKLLKYEKIKDKYLEEITEFDEYTLFTDAYIMKHQDSEFLIIVGQAAGATGIGVDYWNYRCYSLDENRPSIEEFSSLIKTPHSIYIDDEGKINHIEVRDNYPRPANSEEVKLDYFPLIINVFKEEFKMFSLDFRCKAALSNRQ